MGSPMGTSMSTPMGGPMPTSMGEMSAMSAMSSGGMSSGGMSSGGMPSRGLGDQSGTGQTEQTSDTPAPIIKKSRTNTPWSPAEEAMLRNKRDQGQTWGEIAKV